MRTIVRFTIIKFWEKLSPRYIFPKVVYMTRISRAIAFINTIWVNFYLMGWEDSVEAISMSSYT